MKTWKKILFTAFFAVVIASVGLIYFFYPPEDTEAKYIQTVESITFFENGLSSPVPQTQLYDMVKAHFESELPQGKSSKKAIIIGYDGCRADALTQTENSLGAISSLLNDNGKAYISYCGGVPYPNKNTQDTSTAPGWCSILTGKWALEHGITGNNMIKSNEHLTLLTTLTESKSINSSAFYVSWKGHFSRKNATYLSEKEYAEEKGLNVTFDCLGNDDGTKAAVICDIEKENCSDFIFTILEFCDHAGHSKGFYTQKKSYKEAFLNADKYALDIIDKIKSRDEYMSEDWLIIITSDHGGYGKDHGKASIQERNTFIITNKSLSD